MDDITDMLRRRISGLEERIRQLEEALMPHQNLPPQEWCLTQQEARVYAHLASKKGETCTKESVMMALYSDRAGDTPELKIVDVFVCKMRKKLKKHGVEILTIWGQGYAIQQPTAAESEAA